MQYNGTWAEQGGMSHQYPHSPEFCSCPAHTCKIKDSFLRFFARFSHFMNLTGGNTHLCSVCVVTTCFFLPL